MEISGDKMRLSLRDAEIMTAYTKHNHSQEERAFAEGLLRRVQVLDPDRERGFDTHVLEMSYSPSTLQLCQKAMLYFSNSR